MIRGSIDVELQPIIALRVRGPTGAEIDLDAIIDTGYTGAITLPYDVVVALGLMFQSEVTVILADGSANHYDVYTAEIEWNGGWQSVQIFSGWQRGVDRDEIASESRSEDLCDSGWHC